MAYNTIRIYGKVINEWKHTDEKGWERTYQFEIAYKDYRIDDGTLVATGSEDFSQERYREIANSSIWTWDGEKLNQGGHRCFECETYSIKYRKSDRKALMKYLKVKYPNAAEIQIRK